MSKFSHPGLKGKITIELAGNVMVHEFTIPLESSIDFDKESSTGTIKLNGGDFAKSLHELTGWIKVCPVAPLSDD